MQDKKENIKKEIGLIIKSKRLALNKSISLLSNEIGLSKSVWLEIENGNRDLQFTTIWRICEGLNIPLSDFIIEIEQKFGEYYFLS